MFKGKPKCPVLSVLNKPINLAMSSMCKLKCSTFRPCTNQLQFGDRKL